MDQSAEQWLEAIVRADRAPVLTRSDLPDRRIVRGLERSGALIRLPGDVVVIRRPTDPEDEVLRRLYWPIVETVLKNYAPSAVERHSAVQILLGDETPPQVLRIRNGRNASNFEIELGPDLNIVVASGSVDGSATQDQKVGDATITLDESAQILIGLELRFLRDNLAAVSVWLRSLVLSRAAVEEAYGSHPRPVVLRRIAHLAEDVGNQRLAEMLADVVRTNQEVRIGRGQTGVGTELVVPPLVRVTPTTRRPWLDRLNLQIDTFHEQLTEVMGRHAFAPPSMTVRELIQQARAAKAHDVYHSTSIEGYRIRYEDVSVILGGSPPRGALSGSEIRNRMAVLGYSQAFDGLLGRIARERGNLVPSTTLVLDLYVDLFQPSVEAGIVDPESLRGWRSAPVFIRNTLYVPPAAEKIGDMMSTLMERLEGLPAPIVSAILGHLMLVTIHPFPDGNGRVGRFLMNAVLLSNGWPWLTIREDDRRAYFEALKEAQLAGDARPFGVFILERLAILLR